MTENSSGGFKAVLGVRGETAEEGRAGLELDATEDHLNAAGTVHGGVLASLVDMAMGAAVGSITDDGAVPATSQLTITYLRPGQPGRLEVTARVTKRGENLTMCEAEVEQSGRTLAHALATFALVDG
jgi:uncharacterized protein (TIGR00369 family)